MTKRHRDNLLEIVVGVQPQKGARGAQKLNDTGVNDEV